MENCETEYAFEFRNLSISNVYEIGKYLTQDNCFQLYHSNIRSIVKNFDELQVLLYDLNMNFEIIALTETWMLKNYENFTLEGYTTHYNHGSINQNDGAIAFVKNTLSHEVNTEAIGEVKSLRIKVKMPDTGEYFYVSVIYRPPSTRVETFVHDFGIYLRTHCNERNEIIVGDLNINILTEDDTSTTIYINQLIEHGFVSCINSPTRVQNNTFSCLDHIFIKTKTQLNLITPLVLETTITDHFSTILEIKMESHGNIDDLHINTIIDYVKLKTYFAKEDWSFLDNGTEDVNTLTDRLVYVIKQHIKNSTRTIRQKKMEKRRKPWITTELIHLINERNKLFQIYKRTGLVTDLCNYKSYRNRISSIVSKTKAHYYEQKLKQKPNDTKFLWNTINDSLNKYKHLQTIIPEIEIDDQSITNNKSKANYFNTYFIEIAKKNGYKNCKPGK